MANSRYNRSERLFENDPTPGFNVPLTAAANRFLGGPSSGSAATPSFRAIVPADLPGAASGARGIVKLAGQLGGTADLPDVRGLRETGGPTLLTIGPVPDGYLLKRSGSTVIGYLDTTPTSYKGETTVTGSAATSMQITGLDLSTDQEYYIRAEVKNANAGTVAFYFEVNGSTTTTGYYRQVIAGSNTTLAGQRDNAPTLRTALTGEVMSFRIWLALDFNGKPRMSWISGYSAGSTLQHASGSWLFNTAGNVTSVEIVGASASSLAVGSKMKVFRTTGGTA